MFSFLGNFTAIYSFNPFDGINTFVLYGITSRLLSIILLMFMVIPVQWRELNRQYKRRQAFGNGYWRMALDLILIVMITVTCAIVPITYQTTRLTSPSDFTLQNWSSFFTNTAILLQAIGWVRIYRSRYNR